MKYNVGDRVKVKAWEKLVEEYGLEDDDFGEYIPVKDFSFTKDMRKFCGQVVTIGDIDGDIYIISECKYEDWEWIDEMFEGKVSSKKQKDYENVK